MELARLYAQFAPEKLLPLLRLSHSYPLEEALRLCQGHKALVPETVFLLSGYPHCCCCWAGGLLDTAHQVVERVRAGCQAATFFFLPSGDCI